MGSMNQHYTAVLWSGWWRRTGRSRWVLMVTDADERRCCEKLHEVAAGGDFLVRAPGRPDPNTERKPR